MSTKIDIDSSIEYNHTKIYTQATAENKQILQEAVVEAVSYGHVNFTNALVEAFEMLKENRENRGERQNNINFKPDDPNPLHASWSKHLYGSNCEVEEPNQAIIMVTDGVPDR